MSRSMKLGAVAGMAVLSIGGLLRGGFDSEKNAATNTAIAVGLRTSRSGACAANLKDGSVLITGGRGANGIMAGSEVFHSKGGAKDSAPMAYGRADHACATLPDGSVLVAGGSAMGGGTINTAEVYNPATGSWRTVGSMSAARSGAAAVQLPGGRVLVAGGESNGIATATLEIYDLSTSSFRPVPGALSSPRMQHASIALPNGKALILGGTDGKASLDTVDVYDASTGTVAPLGRKMSTPREGLSATVLLDGRVFIAGGSDGKNETATTEIFDPKTNTFTPAATMTVPRKGHLAILVPNNHSIMITGGNARGGVVVATELYIPWKNRYKVFGPGGVGPKADSSGVKKSLVNAAAAAVNENAALALAAEGEEPVLPTLTTDKADYYPGEVAQITGSGWPVNTDVTLYLERDPNAAGVQPNTWTVMTDASGNLATAYDVLETDLSEAFTLTAYVGDTLETAQIKTVVTFTDSPKVGSVTVGAQSGTPTAGAASSATYTITVNRGAGGSSNGAFTATFSITPALPGVTTPTFSPNPVAFTPGDNVKTATLTLATTGSTPAGTTPFTVRAAATSAGDFAISNGELVVNTGCAAASVTANPTSQSIGYGNDATFSAAASGSPAATVRWQVSTDSGSTWIDVPGATGTTLTLTQPAVALSGNRYRAIFTNTCNGAQTVTTTGAPLTVTPKTVTGSFTAADKEYDGNTNASISGRSLSGAVAGDAVSLSGGTATFANKNVEAGKTVTATGLTLSGTNAGNYALSSTTATATASITAKGLTVSATGVNKVYDGNSTATVTLSDDRVPGDVLTTNYTTASFTDKNVGAGKTINVSGISIAGADAGNYTVNATASATANITPASLTPSITANNKIYDSTTAATIATRSLATVFGSDDVALSGDTATFADKSVGNAKTVTATGLSLTGTDAGNYNLSSTSATATANITALGISGSFTAGNKVYDGMTAATITGRSLAGVLSGDTVSLIDGSAVFQTKSVGTGKTVTGSGFNLSGVDAGNYTVTVATATADITTLAITGTVTVANKVYDGTITAAINGYSLTGAVAGDAVTLTGGTATFANKNVGNGQTVTVVGLGLGGNDAANYTVNATASATANITTASLTPSITATNKTYDSTPAATLATRSLATVFGSDSVTLSGGTAAFADKSVGNAKTVTATGLSLTGTDAGNYNLSSTSATATANITALGISGSFTAGNKVYDGMTAATITGRSLAGVLSGDSVSLIDGSAVFQTKSAGNGKMVTGSGFNLSGVDAGNYTVTVGTATADITPLAITGTVTVANKVYDGTTAATINTRSLAGAVAADAVTLTGGAATFADENVGNGKTVTVTGLGLSGSDAGNYTVNSSANTNANITPRPMTIQVASLTKVYGQWNPPLTGTVTGLIVSDAITITYSTAATQTSAVGPYPITASLAPNERLANYTLTNVSGTLTITQATPILIVTGGNFDFDGKQHPVAASIAGVNGDTLTNFLAVSYNPAAVPLLPGNYLATVTFPGTTNYVAVSQSANITIVNPAATNLTITGPTPTTNVYAVGAPVTFTATFTDTPGDTHTAVWNFDALSLASPNTNLTINETAGTVTGKYTFTSPGVYKVKVSLTDCAPCAPGSQNTVAADSIDGMLAIVVIYDPAAGFVTGGGWIDSKAGSSTQFPLAIGKANFGFVSKYQKGASKPTGETEFQFKAGNLNFNSTSYDWLVVSGPMAQYKGIGNINGHMGYKFLLTARDGNASGGGGIDGMRMKITDMADNAIYDNMLGAANDNTSANVQALGGGSIQIHAK